MKTPLLLAPALAFFLLLPAARAQQEIPPAEAAAMLSKLKDFKETNKENVKAYRGKVVQEIAAAAQSNASAIACYLEAVKATDFSGKNRENTQFRDWKKKNEEKIKSPDMQNAVRLQLTYLVLTLQHAAGMKTKDLIGPLMQYCNQVLEDPELEKQPELKKPLSESLIVKWYNIGGLLPDGEGEWEMSPGNVEGIYETTVLPALREVKDPRLIQYWDAKIAREGSQARQSALAFNAGKFIEVRKPALLWNRAEDLLVLGQKSKAIGEMFALIKAHPSHPQVGGWIGTLEGILSAAAPAPAPLPASSPVPGATPLPIPPAEAEAEIQ